MDLVLIMLAVGALAGAGTAVIAPDLWWLQVLVAMVVSVATLLLLHVAFGSFRPALLTFLLLPMALVGGAIAVWMSGRVLSLGSLVGFLAVFGIAARNGILMVSHFQHLERVEGVKFGAGLVIQGAKERLAPIMMTALATGLALVPLVVAGSIPGHEIEHPMAIVILGGLDSLVGALVAGLFVGIVQSAVAQFQQYFPSWVGPNVAAISPYVLMMIALLVRPYGFFGTREVERV